MRGIALAVLLWPLDALAIEPGEVLDDLALQACEREISATLRGPVCRNESIDESHAEATGRHDAEGGRS